MGKAVTKELRYFGGVGRRKAAIAQARLTSGENRYSENDKELELPNLLKQIFESVGLTDSLKVSLHIIGGGMTSRGEAASLAVARALVKMNPEWRSSLRKSGYLTVDARVKERKKPGLKRARRAPQWAKR